MKRVLWLVLTLSVISASAANAQTPSDLAYVSPQRAFAGSAFGKTALARMSALEAEKRRQVEERNKALEAARLRQPDQVAKFEIDVRRFIQDAQVELAGVQRDAETTFLAKFKPALEDVVKAKNLRLVFNEDVGLLAWADPTLDITSEVVKRLDLAAK